RRDAGGLVEPCQLLVRPHPIVYCGWTKGQGSKADLARYLQMGRQVHCDEPILSSDGMIADLAPEDTPRLAETLFHSAVVLTFFSTLMVDSSAISRPVIAVAFDGFKQRHYYRSVRRVMDVHCIRRVLSTGAVSIAHEPDELVRLVNRYLLDPQLESAERRRLALAFCDGVDGRAAERV